MLLGASGVTHAPLQTIGTLSGTSSSDGSFNDVEGYGGMDFDSSGNLYVFDSGNNRVQKFTKNATTGIWAYVDKLTSVGTLIGGGSSTYGVLAIDRSTTPNQIHLTYGDYSAASNWVSVWSLGDWPSLTTLNRLRQWGANSGAANIAGRSFLGISLAVDSTYAVVSSAISPFRLLRWNHVTGVLQNEETQGAAYSQFVTDGAGNWWSGSQSGATEVGLWKMNVETFTGISRLDEASQSQNRRNQFYSSSGGPRPLYHNGRIYARDGIGRVQGWSTDGTHLDDFFSSGALGASNLLTGGHSPSHATAGVIYRDKGVIVTVGDKVDYIQWAHNANGSASQCFLMVYPLQTSTATWTKTDWSSGTNTIEAIVLTGTHLSGEKCKIRLRKNAGSWVTLTMADLLNSSSYSTLGTFTDGDTLTFELSLSTCDRLDGAATLTATRDKFSPANVNAKMYYDDTAATTFTPTATASFKAKIGASGAFKARIQG